MFYYFFQKLLGKNYMLSFKYRLEHGRGPILPQPHSSYGKIYPPNLCLLKNYLPRQMNLISYKFTKYLQRTCVKPTLYFQFLIHPSFFYFIDP